MGVVIQSEGGASQVALVVKNLPGDIGDTRDAGSMLGSGRSPGEGNGRLLGDSCLESPMYRGAWQATYNPRGRKESDMTECRQTNIQSEELCFGKSSEAVWRRGKNCFVPSILCLGNTGAQAIPLC